MTLRRANLLLILALFALAIRAVVPAGFMPGTHDGRLTLDICTGQGSAKIDVGVPGKPGKADAPCAFSGMAAPLLPGTALVLLALAVFLAAVFPGRARPVAVAALRLRPPLRGPPAA